MVALEACGGAHHWGRLAIGHGHRVLMMGPQFVAPYVKSNKNDVNDADTVASGRAGTGSRCRTTPGAAASSPRPERRNRKASKGDISILL